MIMKEVKRDLNKKVKEVLITLDSIIVFARVYYRWSPIVEIGLLPFIMKIENNDFISP